MAANDKARIDKCPLCGSVLSPDGEIVDCVKCGSVYRGIVTGEILRNNFADRVELSGIEYTNNFTGIESLTEYDLVIILINDMRNERQFRAIYQMFNSRPELISLVSRSGLIRMMSGLGFGLADLSPNQLIFSKEI